PDDAAHRASARGSPGAAMTGSVPGVLLGAVAGLGLVLVLSHVRNRRVRLDERLAPYLRPARTTSQLLVEGTTQTPLATLQRLLRPWMDDGVRLVARFGAPSDLVRSRLVRAGRAATVEQFRAEQVVSGVLGLLVGLAIATLVLLSRPVGLASLVVIVVAAAVAGVVLPDYPLQRQVNAREAPIGRAPGRGR